MSIILALKDENGHVHCLSDSAVTIGETLKIKTKQKLFIDPDKDYIVGAVGVGRFIDALRYVVYPLRDENMSAHEYMVRKFVPVVKEQLEKLFFDDEDADNGFTIIVAFKGNLFTIHNDFTLLEHEHYMAIGVAQEAGIIALHLVGKDRTLNPYHTLLTIMDSIIEHTNYVSKPLHYFHTGLLND